MSQLELLRDVWDACSADEREQFMQLLIKEQLETCIPEEEEVAEEVHEEVPEQTQESCALCLSDLSDEKVNPYECIHEFCSGCYNANKHRECLSNCPMCRAVLTLQLDRVETSLSQALKLYIIILDRYSSSRSKSRCVVTDILFDNVDILPQFRMISTSPVNFMTRGVALPDGGVQWESGIYTLTSVSMEEVPIYSQRYMFVHRRSDTYIKYCVLFETIDLVFKGRHLKDFVYATGDKSEYFNGNTPSSPTFIRRNWTKVCDITISIIQTEYEAFLSAPCTIKSNIDLPLGYNELDNYFRDVLSIQLHGMIALYISLAHDLLIYESTTRHRQRIPYSFLCFKKYSHESQEERIFLKPDDYEIPIHNIIRSRF